METNNCSNNVGRVLDFYQKLQGLWDFTETQGLDITRVYNQTYM